MKHRNYSPTLNALRPLAPAYLALVGLSVFIPILFLSGPFVASNIMERVFASRNVTTLYLIAGIGLFLLAIYAVLGWVRQKALQRIGADIDRRLCVVLFDAMHRPRTGSGSGASPSTLSDFNTVRDTLSGPSVSSVLDSIWSPIFIIVLLLLHWVFGFYALIMLLISIGLSALNYFLVQKNSQRFSRALIKANEFGFAITRNAEVVRALGMLPRLRDRWSELHNQMLGWQQAMSRPNQIISAVNGFFRVSQFVMIYAVGAILYLRQEIEPASIFIAMIVMMRGMAPLDSIIANWRNYSGFASALRRVDRVLQNAERMTEKVSLPELVGPLVVSRVFAAVPGGNKPILSDISFSVAQGRTVGVVGPSGAGKSCLGRILVGIWSPQRGSVVIGDHDLSHWNEDELGLHLGYMPQDVEFLPGSVAENIARFDPKAAKDASGIISAVELAGIPELIKSLPGGYNTRLGPDGHVLSGGQRSRLALARAVYDNPNFIVLDEPNSNLDALAEQSLLKMLQKLQANQCTVIIITHKLNILNYCDDILVLNAGTVQAFGSREQIVDRIPRLRGQPSLTVIEGAVDGRRT